MPRVQEPLFGLTYNSNVQKFVDAPAGVLKLCGLESNPALSRRSVYAQASAGDWTYMILGGLVRSATSGPDGTWQSDVVGEFLRVDKNHCDLIDPGNDAFPPANYQGSPASADPAFPISMATYTVVADDAVRRYVVAFGSKAALVKALKRQNRFPVSATSLLRVRLDAFDAS